MKTLVYIFILAFGLTSCSVQRMLTSKKVKLNHEKGKVVLNDEKYILYLDDVQIRQYLEKKSERKKEEDNLLNTLRTSSDTLVIEKPSSNLDLKKDYQAAIVDVLFDFMSNGNCAIYNKHENKFIDKMKIESVKGSYGGKQVNFKLEEDIFINYVLSLGE